MNKPILWWNDNGVVLQCRECLTPVPGVVTRLVWWEQDVTGLTPRQVVKISDQHMKEKHA